MDKITIQLDQQEQEMLFNILDAALRANGMQALDAVKHFRDKLQASALQARIAGQSNGKDTGGAEHTAAAAS